MSKSTPVTHDEGRKLFTPRFVIALLLVVAGIAWIAFYYAQARGNPTRVPAGGGLAEG